MIIPAVNLCAPVLHTEEREMDPREEQTTWPNASLESGSGARRRWIAPIVLLVLMVGTTNLVSRAGQPLLFSFNDVLLLTALAVVTGIYVVLVRADEAGTGREDEAPGRRDARGPDPASGAKKEPLSGVTAKVSVNQSAGWSVIKGGATEALKERVQAPARDQR